MHHYDQRRHCICIRKLWTNIQYMPRKDNKRAFRLKQGMRMWTGTLYLYCATSPFTGLACIIHRFYSFFPDPFQCRSFWWRCPVFLNLFKNSKERLIFYLVNILWDWTRQNKHNKKNIQNKNIHGGVNSLPNLLFWIHNKSLLWFVHIQLYFCRVKIVKHQWDQSSVWCRLMCFLAKTMWGVFFRRGLMPGPRLIKWLAPSWSKTTCKYYNISQ